jgi:hypothetical protein
MSRKKTGEKVCNHPASNSFVNFWSGRFAVAVGGALVGSTLAERDMGGVESTPSVVVAAIVAVLVVVQVREVKSAATTICVGAAVLVVSMWSGSWFDGLGAGLVLGGLLVLADTGDRAWMQSALAAGVVAGVLSPVESTPRRYADYLSDGSDASDGLVWVLLVVTLAAVLGTLATSGFGQIRDLDRSSRIRVLAIGVGIPVVALLTRWWFAEQIGPPPAFAEWIAGGVLVAAVVVAAFVSSTAGIVLLAGLAVSVVDAGPYVVESRWVLLVSVAAAVVGMLVGRRWPVPVVGFGVLALVMVPTVFDVWSDPIVLLPAFTGYLFASCLPSDGALAAVGVLGPLLLFVPFAEQYGWTAVVALDDNRYVSSFVGDMPAYDEQALAAVVTILLCGAVAWKLRRRKTIESA